MSLFRRRRDAARLVPRHWFADDDGTYYRNCPLIAAERDEVMAWPLLTPGKFEALDALFAEWEETSEVGVQRKDCLEPGDVVTVPCTFREAYPDNPGLWALDNWPPPAR
jgi:hypothetical protein